FLLHFMRPCYSDAMVSKAPARDLNLVGNIRAIKAEIARLQGLLDEASAELHGGGNGTAPSTSRSTAIKKARHVAAPRLVGGHRDALELVAGSAASWAADAIREAGKPLHMKDLVKAIEAKGHRVKATT